ncbi:MAG TPA: RDD family protein [Casimicrobiaceae bacterium]|nr:RDD family protein [Casimicrobiaceae bacterium]
MPRRIAASAYDALTIAALLVAVAVALLPFVTPSRGPRLPSESLYIMSPETRALSAAVSLVACGLYCTGFWSGGRRTLAMKTWHLALHTPVGDRVGAGRALLRYLGCLVGPALAIACFAVLHPLGYGAWALLLLLFNHAWAIVDPDRQFLQDRLAGTRLVLDPARWP